MSAAGDRIRSRLFSRTVILTPSRPNVSKKREEMNCVPLSVVNVTFASCRTEDALVAVEQRCERFHPTISHVQQSITHEVRPTHAKTRPDLGHVRLPDLIRPGLFHATAFLFPSCSETTRAHQQPTLARHP
jgi:hypothetical protein